MTTNDVVVRAVKTFFQTFFATFLVGLGAGDVADLSVWKRAVLAAVAAGLSAAWNLVLRPAFQR